MKSKAKIKVFSMNDCDWWAAETVEQAMEDCAKNYGYKTIAAAIADDMIDNPQELSDADMERLKLHREDGTEVSFREELAEQISRADDESFPHMFASTEY